MESIIKLAFKKGYRKGIEKCAAMDWEDLLQWPVIAAAATPVAGGLLTGYTHNALAEPDYTREAELLLRKRKTDLIKARNEQLKKEIEELKQYR